MTHAAVFKSLTLIIAAAALCIAGCSGGSSATRHDTNSSFNSIDHSDVTQVLNQWHSDAAHGNTERYFDAMTEGSIFMGTDESERWDREAFRTFATPHFADGHGWAYHPRDRHIRTNAYGDVAWVDEALDHDTYGTLRGTAIMRLNGDEWKIAFYSLTFLVPNDKTEGVVNLINGSHE